MKTLSIAVPTYNRSGYLRNFLTSLMSWSKLNIEVIISDDCSADDTPSVVQEFTGRLNIRYMRQPKNRGPIVNAIAAFQFATGDYIWCCGDDDTLVEQSLYTAVQMLEADLSLVAVYGSSEYRSHDTGEVLWTDWGLPRGGNVPERINLANVIELFNSVYMSEIFVARREHFNRFIYNEARGLWFGWTTKISLLEHGDICLVPDVFVIKYVDDSSLSFKSVLTQRCYIDDFELFFAKLQKNHLSGKVPQKPNPDHLLKKILFNYEVCGTNSTKWQKAYLDSQHQLSKRMAWEAEYDKALNWERSYLFPAAMEKLSFLISLFHDIDSVIFEDSPLGRICGDVFHRICPGLNTFFLSRQDIIDRPPRDNEFILADDYVTLQQRVSSINSDVSRQRAIRDLLRSCSLHELQFT